MWLSYVKNIILFTCAVILFSKLHSSAPEFLPEGRFQSDWSPFCEDDVYYKPYIRIKNGRYGPLLKDRGPGILDVSSMEDIYVCANGLVFLYFKITNFWGEIYDDAVMQYASHYCGFYNGKLGPGILQRNITLYAILLVGNPKDYRKIAFQMFTAPSYNPLTKLYENYTSLAIINTNGECIMEKGLEEARIRIKGNAPDSIASQSYAEDEEHHTTICRLDIKILLNDNEGSPKPIPIDTELVPKEEALAALEIKGEGYLRFKGCWQYPIIDKKQLKIINDRMNKSLDDTFQIDKVKSELNPEDGEGLSFWTKERLEKYGNPTSDPKDNGTLASDLESKNSTYQEEISKPKDERDKEKVKVAMDELRMAQLNIMLEPYLRKYKEFFDSAKKYGEETKTGWTSVWDGVKEDAVNHTMVNYTLVQEDLSRYYYSLRLDPYDVTLLEKIEESEKAKRDFFQILQDKTATLGPEITKAEVSSARYKSYKAQASTLMKKIQNMIKEFEIHTKKETNNKAHLDTEVTISENFQDMLLSIKNPGGGGDTPEGNDPCVTFIRKIDQCKSIKPTQERACHVAGNLLSGGKGLDNEKSWLHDTFDLLERIFFKSCPYLPDGFATSINGVIKGYIAKEPEGIGLEKDIPISGSPVINATLQHFISNYKVNTSDSSTKERDSAVWDQILKALHICEKNIKPLKFKNNGVKPIRFTFDGKDIPNHLEQADKEFAFNWAIDMNYRIFSTVLGMCTKQLDTALSKKFYDEYHSHVLDPLRLIWLNNRDNAIFKVLMGQYSVTGKGNLWSKLCMESSFISSGKANMRPIRKLLVNSYTEPNYFVEGPMKGTRSSYYLPSLPHPSAGKVENSTTKSTIQ